MRYYSIGGAHTDLLAGGTNGLVVLVQDDAHLIHESNLLLIVTVELRGAGGVDIGEETKDVFGRDGCGLRCLDHGSCCCRHFAWEYTRVKLEKDVRRIRGRMAVDEEEEKKGRWCWVNSKSLRENNLGSLVRSPPPLYQSVLRFVSTLQLAWRAWQGLRI